MNNKRTLMLGLGTLTMLLPLTVLSRPSAAAVTNPVAATAMARQQAAYEMLVLKNGGTEIAPEVVEIVSRQMREALIADPIFSNLEMQHPGLTAHVVKQMNIVRSRQTRFFLAELFSIQSKYYADNMTLAEIKEVTSLLINPLYPSVRKKIRENYDFSASINDQVKNPYGGLEAITVEDISEQSKNAASKAKDQFTVEEQKVLLALEQSTAWRKFSALDNGALAIEADLSNRPNPEQEIELDDAIAKAIDEFIRLSPP